MIGSAVRTKTALAIALAACIPGATLAQIPTENNPPVGWWTYRANNGRTGYVPDALPNRLTAEWVFQTNPPAPAWPAPARGSYWQQLDHIEARVVDDRAYHPVVADGRVLFGSSADDHLYCLDLVDGRVLWTYAAGGPIRYAPSVAGGRVYFGSDDGVIYCLRLDDGRDYDFAFAMHSLPCHDTYHAARIVLLKKAFCLD